VQGVAEGLQQFVRELAESDSSPGLQVKHFCDGFLLQVVSNNSVEDTAAFDSLTLLYLNSIFSPKTCLQSSTSSVLSPALPRMG